MLCDQAECLHRAMIMVLLLANHHPTRTIGAVMCLLRVRQSGADQP